MHKHVVKHVVKVSCTGRVAILCRPRYRYTVETSHGGETLNLSWHSVVALACTSLLPGPPASRSESHHLCGSPRPRSAIQTFHQPTNQPTNQLTSPTNQLHKSSLGQFCPPSFPRGSPPPHATHGLHDARGANSRITVSQPMHVPGASKAWISWMYSRKV